MPRQRTPAETIVVPGKVGLTLSALTPRDAQAYFDLVDRNRDHLTKHGDYSDLGGATPESVTASLADPHDKNAKFGIWLTGSLICRVDLSPRVPGHFVLGYWLGHEYTGRGYATIACRALIEYGRDTLGATNVFAGVTKGNTESEALLGRLGFEPIEDKGARTLFKRALASDPAPAVAAHAKRPQSPTQARGTPPLRKRPRQPLQRASFDSSGF